MPHNKVSVRFTANFEANLTAIQTFWNEQQAPQAFAQLLDELGDTVIGNLEHHPDIGRLFFARAPQSIEVRSRVVALQKRLGSREIREYLVGDYLVLYSIDRHDKPSAMTTIHLLAIRHHRQLSFDFASFWPV